MPIRPEDRPRFERAGGRCECDGRCGSKRHAVRFTAPSVYESRGWLHCDLCGAEEELLPGRDFDQDHEQKAAWRARHTSCYQPGRCEARHGLAHPVTGSRVVLTCAHLDRTPENLNENNLMAMCQACHLAYDRDQHAASRKARS